MLAYRPSSKKLIIPKHSGLYFTFSGDYSCYQQSLKNFICHSSSAVLAICLQRPERTGAGCRHSYLEEALLKKYYCTNPTLEHIKEMQDGWVRWGEKRFPCLWSAHFIIEFVLLTILHEANNITIHRFHVYGQKEPGRTEADIICHFLILIESFANVKKYYYHSRRWNTCISQILQINFK